jgi:tetratricopeptide (TPR) repeat protein
MAYATEAVRIAEEAAYLSSGIFPQSRLGQLALCQGDLQHAIPMLERALAQCRAADTRLFLSVITANLGQAYALSRRVAEALPLLGQVMVLEDTEMTLYIMIRVDEAYLLAGRLEEAHTLAERLLALALARQERGHQAYALWLLGEIVPRRDPLQVEPATAHYQQALALANELGMRPLQAHCHLGLGTLYTTTGQREQAHAALITAIAFYRAMDMTFWLPQAEATLAQVG